MDTNFVGPAQRRFRQFKERRKSLGIVLDNDDFQHFSPLNNRRYTNNTSNIELDDCLIHHLERACHSLTAIDQCQNTPFEFTLTEMLIRMEAVSASILNYTFLGYKHFRNFTSIFGSIWPFKMYFFFY